jgi:outer membrane lipoprotein SlyB
LKANVYDASQVNKVQDAKVINIISVMPAQIQVSNKQAQQLAEVGGGVLGAVGGGLLGNKLDRGGLGGTALGGVAGGATGAAAGSLVPGKTLVEGVSLTYDDGAGHTLNSTEVGRSCEYKPGKAVMVSTSPTETRIQPNDTCPPPAP